jgi:hypothetical protein
MKQIIYEALIDTNSISCKGNLYKGWPFISLVTTI